MGGVMLCGVGGAVNGLRAWLRSAAEQKFCRPSGGDETSWAPAQTWDLTIGKLWASGPADGPGPLKEQD